MLRIGVVHTGFLSSLNRRVLKWLNGSKLVRVWSLTVGRTVCGRATKCENRVFVTRVNITWKVKFVLSKRF